MENGNEFWQSNYHKEQEEFLKSNVSDLDKKYRNCFVSSLAKYLIANKFDEARKKTSTELMDYILENYVEIIKYLPDGYVVRSKVKNIDISCKSALLIRGTIRLDEMDYIKKFDNCLVIQEFNNGKQGHAEYIEIKEIHCTQVFNEPSLLTIFLN